MVSLLERAPWSDDECGGIDEKEPMLGPRDQFSIQEAEDSQEDSQSKLYNGRRWMNSKFSRLYCALIVLAAVAVASLVLAVVLLVSVKQFGDRLEDANARGQNAFQKAFTALKQQLIGGVPSELPANAIHPIALQHLSPEQIAQAKAAGLIPVNAPVQNQPVETHVPKPHVPSEDTWRKDWHDPKCDIRCGKTDVTVPPLIVISLDGFVADYLQRKILTTLERLKECGSAAEFMYPSFPSKTFPNHYSMATGLYPESHGIVDNTVFDPLVEPELVDAKKTNNSKFYLGEPIWSAVERNGHKSACLFWPGCGIEREAPQKMPTYNLKYNKSFSYSERVDTIVNWLKLPMQERPRLIMAYFDQPDSVGHYHKSDEEVNLELVHLEGLLHYFLSTLYALRWLDCVNLVVVSDHGMHTLQRRFYFSERIDTAGLVVSSGVIGRIHLADSGRSYDSVAGRFECQDHGQTFRVYNRSSMPVRFHYSASPRVGDVVFEGRPGTTFFKSPDYDTKVTSDHGFDYLDESMHAIFFARGPNVQRATLLDPFQNIELLNLFLGKWLLPLRKALLRRAVLNVNPVGVALPPALHPIAECREKILFVKREVLPCQGSEQCSGMAERVNAQLQKCPIAKGPYGTFHSANPLLCFSTFCSTSVLSLDSEFGKGDTSMVYEPLSTQQLPPQEKKDAECDLYLSVHESDCALWNDFKAKNRSEGLVFRSVAVDSSNGLNNLHDMTSLLYESFFTGAFARLQNLTTSYVQKYKRLVSISGTVFDLDTNGRFDSRENVARAQNHSGLVPPPTHVFRILLRCEDSLWHIDGQACQNPAMTRVLSFVLPNQPRDPNCMSSEDYLLANTARLRDIELLTDVRFFAQQAFPEHLAVSLRTHIPRRLWD
ncbi:hypothetical protein QR680_005522 [Steinernema hermaphroditum]|uniref:ENPP1-3/EXOG-like endonuclease/phosphodiesterase domain-containing protein n=1 Tax=Steinernema hermaphroditum TaxID=289476 RepID=A0AA39HUI3_9BILA|nr:hypothetical protein QR680_005522 [Steinernema hermaphroditum]